MVGFCILFVGCYMLVDIMFFFFSSRRRHTRFSRDWSSDVCSSDLSGGKPTPAAVPTVTTACIIGRNVARIAGLLACGRAVCFGRGLVTSSGGRHVPLATAATTVAWLSGLTRSFPWPKASAARSTGELGLVNWPRAAGMPSPGLALKPYVLAIVASEVPDRCCVASSANVVLHEMAKALSRFVVPRCSLRSLWKVRPPMLTLLGHCTWLDGVKPVLASPEAVTTLKVDPGGNVP